MIIPADVRGLPAGGGGGREEGVCQHNTKQAKDRAPVSLTEQCLELTLKKMVEEAKAVHHPRTYMLYLYRFYSNFGS